MPQEMRKLPVSLDGPVLLAPPVHRDPRGFFLETYRAERLTALGVADEFVQDNHSRSVRGVTRGMHFQSGQAKLVRCARGAILDVLVDIRPGSPQFGRWEAYPLTDEDHHLLYVPAGFAHGFCVTSELADVVYKASAYYDPEAERGFAYDDPDVAIAWPRDVELIVSGRDREAPPLAALAPSLPSVHPA